MSYVLLLLAVLFFVLLNGFFVAAEFALVRSRRSKMEQEGARGATLALKQIERIDEYLSACQLGITMASLAIGFLGEPAIADLFREIFGEPFPHEVTLPPAPMQTGIHHKTPIGRPGRCFVVGARIC